MMPFVGLRHGRAASCEPEMQFAARSTSSIAVLLARRVRVEGRIALCSDL